MVIFEIIKIMWLILLLAQLQNTTDTDRYAIGYQPNQVMKLI